MATKASIELDFRKAISQAEKLEEMADRLSNASGNQLGGMLQSLSSAWKGENASAYLNKGSGLQNKMNASASDLRGIAFSIRTIAGRIRRSELDALEIALRRKY